ncbi:Meiotically up-regulated gene 80 [Lecanosticta acicola]|uniref:Meiotically up-regulated gene 80 n=1 Tax=Lecanosticta acicola TaxID=111012 RepID=A0AAI9EDI4_9PEZI|nr:Meiotically up-regulated gene 80 [Lecanosticta acicola]
MTSTQRPPHMYPGSAIRFRDPFVVSKDLTPPKLTSASHDPARTYWYSNSRCKDVNRALTPPPEMSGVQQQQQQQQPQPSRYANDHGYRHAEHIPAQQSYGAHGASYQPQDVITNHISSRQVTTTQSNGRASPVRQVLAETSGDALAHGRPSQANAIAANFQVPRSVNDSGGSLAELAAQITCLFWFESSDLLQQVEDATIPLQPLKQLVADAKPTTGFRKWVTTILSTTMVAQNVVVLALLFIYRLKKLNPTVKGKPGSEYRLLTVALMLGNKFLDDNTYTNKTWAEVSGINVAEVHIMEVEFLSNMKYCLFTCEQDWARWQSLLGKFAAFFEKASRPQPPAPILPPASSLHLPMALPSPPASNQASPPYSGEFPPHAAAYSNASQLGPTPAPSPLGNLYDAANGVHAGSRKRSRDEHHTTEPPPKRLASAYQNYTSPQRYSTMPAQAGPGQPVPRLTLPSLSIPTSQASSAAYPPTGSQGQQLPPLQLPARSVGMAYHSSSSQPPIPHTTASANASMQPQSQPQSQYASRHPSPYGGSGQVSPSSALPQSATVLHPTDQVSPTYFLQQRTSPYRPVHNVSTLLYPPPSSATSSRPPNVELNQMQYQPLGKPVQHTGRLPYVRQNVWLDGNQPQEMTPIHQWPGFPSGPPPSQHLHPVLPQQ